jgi:hypothetical protein
LKTLETRNTVINKMPQVNTGYMPMLETKNRNFREYYEYTNEHIYIT